MKLATIQTAGDITVALIQDDNAYVFPNNDFPSTMIEWIRSGQSLLSKASDFAAQGKCTQISKGNFKFLTPIHNPGKIVAIGLNYMDHIREQNVEVPEKPIVFTKFTTAIIGPGDTICWDPQLTDQVDYEVELGVVIGRRARKVSVDQALSYIFGYTVINDVSARDLQFSDNQWVRAKSLDTFCPIGPVILTADEITDPQALHLKTTVNGQVLQDSTTAEMVFGVADIISRISHSFTLEPGDLIATGTPDGVGVFRDPQVFLKDGDTVVVEVEKIGALENKVELQLA
jgi:2-keto-4-pentenoate hydratase/2-oxohepta-3-ene-1,7-dioic acid hydratase in catechol pathway